MFAPQRDTVLDQRELGHVVYAIGVTSDFRTRPFDTITAHVSRLNEVLRNCRFDSLTYLSSTRVYQGVPVAAGGVDGLDETCPLTVDPQRPDDLYNLSKLAGESLALNCGRAARVVRLSNVYGVGDDSENFLASIVRSAVATGSITFGGSATSAKDYVSQDDVIAILPQIALAGSSRIYNVCSGVNTSHAELAQRLSAITGCRIEYAAGAKEIVFPRLSNHRLQAEFGFRPTSVLDHLSELVAGCRAQRELAAC